MKKQHAALLKLLITSIVWGFSMSFQRVADACMTPFQFNTFKYLLAGLSLLPFLLARSKHDRLKLGGGDLLRGAIVGFALFAAALGQQSGVGEAGAGKAGFLTSLYVVLVPLAGLFLKQKMRPVQWLALVPALAGSYLLCIAAGADLSLGRAEAALLAGALFWTVHIQCTDHFVRRTDPLLLCTVQFFAAALFNLAGMLATGLPDAQGMGAAIFPLLYCGILSTGFGFLMQAVGQRDAPPSPAALVMSLEAVFSMLSGVLLLGEQMTARSLLGSALMMTGVLMTQIRKDALHV